MRKIRLILFLAVIVACTGMVARARAAEIVVNEAETVCPTYCPADTFGRNVPIGFHVSFTINGDPGDRYKAILTVNAKSLGEKIIKKYPKVSDGDVITFTDFRMIDGIDRLGRHTVKFQLKLKKDRELIDKQVVTEDIFVIPDYVFSNDCPISCQQF